MLQCCCIERRCGTNDTLMQRRNKGGEENEKQIEWGQNDNNDEQIHKGNEAPRLSKDISWHSACDLFT